MVWLGVSLLYIALARGVLLSDDEQQLFQTTQGIAERGQLRVSSSSELDGRDLGVGLPLMALPAYWLADSVFNPLLSLKSRDDENRSPRLSERIYGTALVNALIGAATVALTCLLTLALGYRLATCVIVALLLASGTLLAHYSALFTPEPLIALGFVTCIYGIVRARLGDVGEPEAERQAGRWLILSGFAAGLAVATRPDSGIALLPVAAWLVWQLARAARLGTLSPRTALRAELLWLLPIAAWSIFVGWSNWERFGNVLDFGTRDRSSLMTTSFFESIYGLLLSPGRGVLWYNPPLLLALLGCGLLIARRPALGITVGAMLALTLGQYASGDAWHGGAVWGTRYLVPLLPLLILSAGEVIEPIWSAAERRAAFVIASVVLLVAAAGIAVTSLSVVVPFDRYAAEYSNDPRTFHDALFTVGAAPLIVHADRIGTHIDTPDLAARRYDSTVLWVVAAAAALLGGLCLLQAARWTIRPPQRVLPPLRLPPPGWGDVPRC